MCVSRVNLLVCSLPLHRHSYIGFYRFRFIDSYINNKTPSWCYQIRLVWRGNTARLTIKLDRLTVLSESNLLGWFLHVSLIVIIKGRSPMEVSLIVIIKFCTTSLPSLSILPTIHRTNHLRLIPRSGASNNALHRVSSLTILGGVFGPPPPSIIFFFDKFIGKILYFSAKKGIIHSHRDSFSKILFWGGKKKFPFRDRDRD